jgi:hypothetical protein
LKVRFISRRASRSRSRKAALVVEIDHPVVREQVAP